MPPENFMRMQTFSNSPSPQSSPACGRGGEREKQSFNSDQAEGLRRLLTRTSAKVVAVVGARSGIGSTSVVLNLAAAWARCGKDVLILDEHLSPNNVANTLALKPRYDLLNVIRGDKVLGEVIMRCNDGIQILPVARAMQALPLLQENERDKLPGSLTQAARGADVVLVDAAAREGHSVCASLSGDEPLMLVLNATASGITESYAMLKKMALHNGRRVFDIVVNKVSNEHKAKMIFDNIAQVAWQNLQVRLEYMGYIPLDEKLKLATQLCRPVVEAFPGAGSSIEFGELARSLMHSKKVFDEEASGLDRVMQRLIRQTRPVNNVVSAIT
jgi:flagellar biosynthesis protein FlhG